MEENEKEPIKIEYQPAKFHRRLLADLIDFLLLGLVMTALFLGIRQIYASSKEYQTRSSRIDETRISSCLFVKQEDGSSKDIVTLYNSDSTLTYKEKKEKYSSAIEGFISYLSDDVSEEAGKKVRDDYNSFRLSSNLNYQGTAYFILDESGNIVENPSSSITYQLLVDNAYIPYIDNHAQGFLSSLNAQYLEDTKYMSDILLFQELPISFTAAALLVFYLPPLIMKRGRKTIGKALYSIGRVDKNYLNLSFGRFTAYSATWIFGILLLSCFTLGVPFLVSFSLMAFSKNKQDFSEYMFSIREVSIKNQKIFYSEDEILMENLRSDKKAVDFKMDSKNLY
jgi:uncharacterized RDD family membrane protein YckC